MQAEKTKAEIFTSREMRTLEVNAEYYGFSLLQLMENAGRTVALDIASRFPVTQKITIFCGLGGNGGDGFVAARHLLSIGYTVSIVLAGKGENITPEAATKNWRILQLLAEKIPVYEVADSSFIPDVRADIIVDALLGTGTKGSLRSPIAQIVKYINSLNGFKIAVDVPTGIDSDTGEVLGEAVKADVTLTFHKAKAGLKNAKTYTGHLFVKDIGLPKELEIYAGPGDVLLVKKARLSNAHKGDFGRLLVVGGSEVFSGAPALVGLAALRTGADIAYVAAPEKTAIAISSISPNLITIKLDGTHVKPSNLETLKEYVKAVDAIVLGPGLGLHPSTKEFVKEFVGTCEDSGKPLLLDADGLKAYGEIGKPLRIPAVFTPHSSEYFILTGNELPQKLKDRTIEVQKTADKFDAVILLKGRTDLICDNKRIKLNFTGNPGMTVGGTGDVLSGIAGAMLAQKIEPFEAAVAAAFVNGAAGDFAAERMGYHMMATDLLDLIPQVLNDPMCHSKVRRIGGKTS
jgi:hydroxyethylthiazole kinase-like uncharacterized protein yjeF